jgi:hypothetical protein
MPVVTIRLRALVAFAVGITVAFIAVFAFRGWRADAAPGETDTTFVPIAPCRLIDTRPAPDRVGSQGTLAANDTRTLQARGSNGQCTIPDDAAGLSLNVTAVGASVLTFLTIWPDGTRPLASSLNPAPGEPPTPNAVATDLSSAGSFNLYNLTGNVDVIVDVNGYYTHTSLTTLAAELGLAESRIAKLELAQPFSVEASDNTKVVLHSGPKRVLTVSLTAPVDGHVTVNSQAVVTEADTLKPVVCSLTNGDGFDLDRVQFWVTTSVTTPFGNVNGTRQFDVAAGETGHYHLLCQQDSSGSFDAYLDSVSMTAIFTPSR